MHVYFFYVYICPLSVLWGELPGIKILTDWLNHTPQPSKIFHHYSSINFWVILLTDKETNKQTVKRRIKHYLLDRGKSSYPQFIVARDRRLWMNDVCACAVCAVCKLLILTTFTRWCLEWLFAVFSAMSVAQRCI